METWLRPTLHGQAASRDALARLLALGPTISADIVQVLASGDVALVVNEWALIGTAADGTAVHQSGRSADVVRRQPDGRWLVVVDKP